MYRCLPTTDNKVAAEAAYPRIYVCTGISKFIISSTNANVGNNEPPGLCINKFI